MFGILTNIEFLTEILDEFLGDLTLVNLQELHVLSAIQLNL